MDLLTIPAVLISLGAILGGVVVGVFYIIGLFGGAKEKNRRDGEDAQAFVINSFKEKIEVLEAKVAAQDVLIKDNAKKLDQLIGENKILKDTLQGRDAETQRFQNMGFEVMSKTLPIMMERINTTNRNVEMLYKAIEKHLSLMEKQQKVTITTEGIPSTL